MLKCQQPMRSATPLPGATVLAALLEKQALREFLRKIIPQLKSGAWRLESCGVREMRKARQKHLLYAPLTCRSQADGRTRKLEVVVKVYLEDLGGQALAALERLWMSGFRPPAEHRIPQPFGYVPELCVLVQSLAPGKAWSEYLVADESSVRSASARAAEWLLRLQAITVPAQLKSWEIDAVRARSAAEDLARSFPGHALRIKAIVERLLERLPPEVPSLVPAHGEYHPYNVFITARRTTVIDFDTFGRREPAFDIGYAIGQLLITSFMKTGSFAAGARAALFFWERYRQEGQAQWRRVAVQVTRALLQSLHYELCTLRNRRLILLNLWPELMEEWLESVAPSTLRANTES